MTEIVFEQPPPQKRRRGAPGVSERLLPLRERPGEWARVYGPAIPSNAYVWAARVRKGQHFPGIVAGDYETVAREGDDGEWFVWARYVGNGS